MINESSKHELMKLLAVGLELTDSDQYEMYKVFDLYTSVEYLNSMIDKYGDQFCEKVVLSFGEENKSFFDPQKFLNVLLTIHDSMIRWYRILPD